MHDNNVEYEALILVMKIAIKLKLNKVKFISDSLLIVNQVKYIYIIKNHYFKNIKN